MMKICLYMEYIAEIHTKTGDISPISENSVPTGSTVPELMSIFLYKYLYF